MKKTILLPFIIGFFLFSSCLALNRAATGDSEKNALKNLSITTDCPVKDMKVISKRKVSLAYRYQIEACNKIYDTDSSGTIFSERDKE